MTKLTTEQIWKDFSAALRVFIRRQTSDAHLADDILQEVFIRIHAGIDSLRDETKLRSWVYQIARNTVIDHFRKHRAAHEELGEIPVCENCEEETPEQEIASGMRAMVEELPDIYKHALLLTEFGKISQTELARKLGVSVSAVKSRVQRGRQLIKDNLMKCCHFEFDRYGTIIDIFPACCCCCCQESESGETGEKSLLLRK
jgi:RNA polymerase sigma-70 factor (ECF subfamily)